MKKIVVILVLLLGIRLLPKALRQEAKALELFATLFQLIFAKTTNSAMTYSNYARTASLETRVGNLEQGIFPNVNNGFLVEFTTDANCTMKASGLAALIGLPTPTTGSNAAWDTFSGSSWGSGERNYIDGLYNWIVNSFLPAINS